MTAAYDDGDIIKLIRGIGRGNPGQDREALLLLRKILADHTNSGLSDDTLA